MSKIAIVSDNSTVLNSIQAKLVLLRENDTIIKCSISEVFKAGTGCDILLFHTTQINDVTLTTISNIKKHNNIIILLIEEIDPNSLLNAYDYGVRDFCTVNVTNFELLIKIINAKKVLKQNQIIERFKSQLREKGIIKANSNAYTKINDIINANFLGEILNSSILAINIEEDSHQEFLMNNIENQFSNILRSSDFIINYEEFKYIIILPQTSIENGIKVFNKLKNKYKIHLTGQIFRYNEENSKDLLQKINKLDCKREEKGLELYIEENSEILEQETENDWLSDNLTEEPQRNYKLFQNIFNKKLEDSIAPAFYRTKQKYEKTFQNTKIKYFTDKNRAEFMLINFDKTNSLQIIYKNSAKVSINLNYSGLDTPENEHFEIPFSKLNTRLITEILENFIEKFNNKKGEQ